MRGTTVDVEDETSFEVCNSQGRKGYQKLHFMCVRNITRRSTGLAITHSTLCSVIGV